MDNAGRPRRGPRRSHQRRRRAAIYRRHHRHPEGAMLTHANISINCQQSAAWAVNLERGQERALAALPFFHVFAMTAVMNFAVSEGCRAHHHAALRARRCHEADRQEQADGHAGGTDHVHGHPEPPAAQELRSLLAQILRLGWRAPAGRTEAKVRATDGLQSRGRLRPDRSLPQRHLQSGRGACEGGLDRPATARHHRLAARPCRPQQGGRRSAKRAKFASKAPK